MLVEVAGSRALEWLREIEPNYRSRRSLLLRSWPRETRVRYGRAAHSGQRYTIGLRRGAFRSDDANSVEGDGLPPSIPPGTRVQDDGEDA